MGIWDTLIKQIPAIPNSYLKNTTHFLWEILNLQVPEKCLVTVGISSLYTIIPGDDGVTSSIELRDLHKQPDAPGSHVIATLTRLFLAANTFEFSPKN